jgi:hypothetical protein
MSAEQKHTAGPYEYCADRTIAADGVPLARCYADRNAAANGPLFAAAPELAQSIRDLLALHEAHHNNPVHAAARAILAKAEARS